MVNFMTIDNNRHSNQSNNTGRNNDSKLTILIADDDDDNRTMLKTLLEIWGYRVLEAKDGGEAFGFAEKARPDLILMDVRMPRFDGFETARRIRRSKKTVGVPIIFISGCAEKSYRNEAGDAGGNEYMVKPVDFGVLEKTLVKYLSGH